MLIRLMIFLNDESKVFFRALFGTRAAMHGIFVKFFFSFGTFLVENHCVYV